jgi:hypothetical protein
LLYAYEERDAKPRSRDKGQLEKDKIMKYLKTTILAASLGLAVLTTGCATVTGGTTQSVSVKTQKDSVDIAGADCVLTNSKGSYKVTTPGSVSVHRAKDDLSVLCTKEGEINASTTFQSSQRAGAIAGDIAFLGVLSIVSYGVDRSSGSIYAYPENMTVSFGNGVAPAPGAPAATPAAAASDVQPATAQVQATSGQTAAN